MEGSDYCCRTGSHLTPSSFIKNWTGSSKLLSLPPSTSLQVTWLKKFPFRWAGRKNVVILLMSKSLQRHLRSIIKAWVFTLINACLRLSRTTQLCDWTLTLFIWATSCCIRKELAQRWVSARRVSDVPIKLEHYTRETGQLFPSPAPHKSGTHPTVDDSEERNGGRRGDGHVILVSVGPKSGEQRVKYMQPAGRRNVSFSSS